MPWMPDDLLNDVDRMAFGNKAKSMIDDFKKQFVDTPDSSAQAAPSTTTAPASGGLTSADVSYGSGSAPLAPLTPTPVAAPGGVVSAIPELAPRPTPQPLTPSPSSLLPSIKDLTASWSPDDRTTGMDQPSGQPGMSSAATATAAPPSSTTDESSAPTSWLGTVDQYTAKWRKELGQMAGQQSQDQAAGGGMTPATRAVPIGGGGTPEPMPTGSTATAGGRPSPRLSNGQTADISMSAGPIAGDDRAARIASAVPLAQQIEAKTGMPAEVNLAFAVHESGLEDRYAPGMSYHGRHAVDGEDGTPIVDWGYDAQGNRVDYPTKLKSYTTPTGSFEDFAHLITTSPTYAKAWQAYQQTGDKAQLVQDIWSSGYGESKQGPAETVDIMNNQVEPAASQARQQPGSVTVDQAPRGPVGVADGKNWRQTWGDNLTPDQIKETLDQGMDWDSAIATCGIAAAVAFARASGGEAPTFGQALRLAQGAGEWNADVGMTHGTSGEIALLRKLNVDAHSGPIDERQIAQTVMAGQPVQINAQGGGGHFYVAQDYDPKTGRFNFGNSATILKNAGGRTWFRLDELPALGVGTPSEAIYLGAGQ